MQFLFTLVFQLVVILGGVSLAYGQASPVSTPPSPGAAATDGREERPGNASVRSYEQHMDNGVKLFREEHWEAAVAEFEAAYLLDKRASPLINLALCYKKLRRYAQAIRMLEKAVFKHADSLQQRHLRAAQTEIKQLRALLAYVHVDIVPKTAQLLVDGRPWRRTARPLALSPGPHVFRAEAKGYAARDVRVRLVSGRDNPLVKILLEATHGKVRVRAHKSSTWIRIDNQPVGRGRFNGTLSPGVHVVELSNDGQMQRIRVVVQAGHTAEVLQDADGELVSTDSLPEPSAKPEPSEIELRSALRGIYLHAGVGLLALLNNPGLGFRSSGVQVGYNLDWRFGYRVNRWGAFELLGQFNHIRFAGRYENSGSDGDATFLTGRLGGGLRAMFPAKSNVRFVGFLGAGVTVQELEFRMPPPQSDMRYQPVLGVSPFGLLELGVELEVHRVLVGVSLQNILQSSKHLTHPDGRNVFDERPLFFIGPSLRLGYAFW